MSRRRSDPRVGLGRLAGRLVLGALSALLGCGRAPDPAATLPSAAATTSGPSPSASVFLAPSASATPPPRLPLQVQRFVLTSDVKGKEPVDELAVAGAGRRLYAHLQLRNRGEVRPLRLEFRVDGAVRSAIDLEAAHSWSYRTWGYNTLRASDAGSTAEARFLDGDEVVASAKIAIGKEAKTRK